MQEVLNKKITTIPKSNPDTQRKWSDIKTLIKTTSIRFLKQDKMTTNVWMTKEILERGEHKISKDPKKNKS